jgi:hypothetical protein
MGDRVLELLEVIAKDLTYSLERPWRWGSELRDPHSLAFGSAGVALFLSYLVQALGEDRHRHSASCFLRDAILATQHEYMQPGFETGAIGICWAVEHLKDSVDVESRELKLLDQWETRLYEWSQMADTPPAFADGLAGICAYAAERHPSHPSSGLFKATWGRLKDLAEITYQGATWHVSGHGKSELLKLFPGLSFSSRRYSMSVGYGVAGIVGALLASYASGIREHGIEHLIESAVSWMMAKRCGADFHQSFPVIVGVEMPLISSGWYLGDLGVITVILNAAYLFERKDWKDAVLEIALRRAESPPTFYIHNLLYGSVGRAHFCNRLFHLTGDQRFADAAFKWYSLALGVRRPSGARGGLLNNGQPFRGLFWGMAGLGLGLLAAISSTDPAWDRFLFGSFRTAKVNSMLLQST